MLAGAAFAGAPLLPPAFVGAFAGGAPFVGAATFDFPAGGAFVGFPAPAFGFSGGFGILSAQYPGKYT